MLQITAHDEGLLVCEECGTRFQTKEGWKIHMKKQHSGGKERLQWNI